MSRTTSHKRRKAGTAGASLPRPVEERTSHHEPFSGSTLSPRFLDETVVFWQPQAKRVLTREDAREIAHNLTGFFSVLREWQAAEELAAKERAPAQKGQPDTSRTRKQRPSARAAHP